MDQNYECVDIDVTYKDFADKLNEWDSRGYEVFKMYVQELAHTIKGKIILRKKER